MRNTQEGRLAALGRQYEEHMDYLRSHKQTNNAEYFSHFFGAGAAGRLLSESDNKNRSVPDLTEDGTVVFVPSVPEAIQTKDRSASADFLYERVMGNQPGFDQENSL